MKVKLPAIQRVLTHKQRTQAQQALTLKLDKLEKYRENLEQKLARGLARGLTQPQLLRHLTAIHDDVFALSKLFESTRLYIIDPSSYPLPESGTRYTNGFRGIISFLSASEPYYRRNLAQKTTRYLQNQKNLLDDLNRNIMTDLLHLRRLHFQQQQQQQQQSAPLR